MTDNKHPCSKCRAILRNNKWMNNIININAFHFSQTFVHFFVPPYKHSANKKPDLKNIAKQNI